MRAMMSLFAAMTVGCTTVQTTFTETIPAADVSALSVDLEQGSLFYTGASTGEVVIDGRAYGNGRNEEKASERQDGNSWGIDLDGAALSLTGNSDAVFAGVDFDVYGPKHINADIMLRSGGAHVENISGTVAITADSIDATNLTGSASLIASYGDVDASLAPRPGSTVRVEANGDVTLWLPWGGDYDLQVWGDPAYEMIIEDLGFGWTTSAPAYFAGQSGPATTRVDVYATGGDVRIYMTY